MNQTTPEPNFLLQLFIALLFVGNVVAVWLGVINGRRIQRREVSFTETPASKKDFDQHVVETARNFNAVRNELAHDRQANQEHASKRSETLFRKMDTTRTELDTKIEDTRRELSDKIDAMPERVITTLKNTGAI
jgi:uncharacterized membrane-anchored protein YhcB (DUF1043 family)